VCKETSWIRKNKWHWILQIMANHLPQDDPHPNALHFWRKGGVLYMFYMYEWSGASFTKLTCILLWNTHNFVIQRNCFYFWMPNLNYNVRYLTKLWVKKIKIFPKWALWMRQLVSRCFPILSMLNQLSYLSLFKLSNQYLTIMKRSEMCL
jgi:hypothetical protein